MDEWNKDVMWKNRINFVICKVRTNNSNPVDIVWSFMLLSFCELSKYAEDKLLGNVWYIHIKWIKHITHLLFSEDIVYSLSICRNESTENRLSYQCCTCTVNALKLLEQSCAVRVNFDSFKFIIQPSNY